MGKKMDILTTLSKGIYTDDSYNVIDQQVVDMINEYYRRFKQYTEFQGRMSITILSLDNLDGKEGEDLRWKKIKEALPEVYDKDFVDFTLINCRNLQEIESAFVDHANFVYNTYEARTIVISRFEIFKDFLKSKEWVNQAQFIVWYDTKEEWEKSRIKTANYEDNLKIDDSVVTIDFDSLKINLYDIKTVLQKILNYREVNHRGKLTFVISDNYTVKEMYDILGLPYNYYKYVSIMGEDSNKVIKENFQYHISKFKSSFICMNEEFLKKCENKDVSRTVYTITNSGITLVKKPKEMPRLSRPYFGDKSDRIEHKAALSQRWYFLLQENMWRDKNGNRHFIPNMPENYIKNCILWLDETLCGKYIPDPDLRRQFKALFQNELSHRDTLNRISNVMTQNALLNNKKFQGLHSQMAIKCGIDVNDLPSMADINIEEEILKQLKDFGTEEVIKHYQNMSYLDKSLKYWENLKYITDYKTGSDKISVKVRWILNGIAFINIRKYALRVEDKVGKESGRWIASEHNYKDLEKDVNKKSAYGTKYWNMPYDELVDQGLWKDADNNIYTISSMRNGHIANIMDMLNTGKYQLEMSPETQEKYKELFADEFRIRNKLKASEPLFLSKEEHSDFHVFGKKANDAVEHPSHYSQTRIECIDAIEACIEPYKDTVDAYLTSNALKYLWRHEFKKNPIEDLKKAVWYINRIIEKYEKGEIK